MKERLYKIMVNGDVVAENVRIQDASIFVRALLEESYNDDNIFVSVAPMTEADKI